MIVEIPYKFKLRPYQVPIYEALEKGYNRAIAVWHRRAGKDKVFLNILVRESLKRVGSYYYIFPYYAQARKAIWEGIDKDGFRNIEHFPEPLVARKVNQDMVIELVNGSIIRFLGSDNIDSIVGTNPVGVIFSEFSVHKVQAWNFLRPILLENEGWAIFNGTPRGKNHFWKLLESARQNPDWYVDIRTILDTKVMTPAQVDEEVELGMPRALAQQEFYCSFDAAMTGAYYGDQIEYLYQQGRITDVPWDPMLPVNTAWDLGINDMTTIWLFQQYDNKINIIDCIADNNRSLQYYVKVLQDSPYSFGYHVFPHDIKQRELSTGATRLHIITSLGLREACVAKRTPIEDGIAAVRALLPKCYFNEPRCAKGIEALKQYRAAYNEDNEVYGAPVHDWSSHYADALRTLATGMRTATTGKRETVARDMNYDPLERQYEPFYSNRSSRPTSYIDDSEQYPNYASGW